MAGGIVLSRTNFFQRLRSDDLKRLGGSNELVKEEIIIDRWEPEWEHRTIKNIDFERLVVIRSVDLNAGIRFENCRFKEGLHVEKVLISKYHIGDFGQDASLLFQNCVIENLVIYECRFSCGILIKGDNEQLKSEVRKIEIQVSFFGNIGININRSLIGGLDVTNVESNSINLSRSDFEGMLRLDGLRCSSVSIVRSTFKERIYFSNLFEADRFILNYNLFEDDLELSVINLKGLFSHGDTFKREFKVDLEVKHDSENKVEIKSNLDEVYFSEMDINERFILLGGGSTISKLSIPFTTKFKGVFKFENCNVLETKISGVNEHAKLIFKRILFKLLSISDFTNLSDLTFSNSVAKEDSDLIIEDSDLGLTKFSDFSFKSFTRIRIENAFLNRIVCSNIDWFEENQLIENTERTSRGFALRNKRELFRQLKQSLSNNGNALDSLDFQAKELQLYRKEKKEIGKYSFGDRIIMLVNMSNDYGLNWLKPLGLILLITLIFYPFLCILNSERFNFELSCDLNDMNATFKYLLENNKLFVELLNPTRSINSVYGEGRMHSAIYWVDSIHRIILGIFIFQMIKAFRKFVMK